MDPMKLRSRLQAKMSSAQTPYDSVSGGVYLQRAWERGAAYAIEQCLEVIASDGTLTAPASSRSRAAPLPARQSPWRRVGRRVWPF